VRGGGAGWLQWSGKSATPREGSPKWVGAPGPAHEDGRCVRRLGTDKAAETEVRQDQGSLPEGGSVGGANKMNGRVLFCSCALNGGNAGLRKEGEREVMARHSARAMGVHARSMAQ
jgi:hypothetical protein